MTPEAKRKAQHHRYNVSEKGRARHDRYNASRKGRDRWNRYARIRAAERDGDCSFAAYLRGEITQAELEPLPPLPPLEALSRMVAGQ
jgi:hypothetical protein